MPLRTEYKMMNFTNWIWILSKNACGSIVNGGGKQGEIDIYIFIKSPNQEGHDRMASV